MTDIAIVLKREQVQHVLDVLAQRPYREVADIIQTIMRQAAEQQDPLSQDSTWATTSS